MSTRKYYTIIALIVLLAGVIGTIGLIVHSQGPALPTTPEGAILIPTDMIQEFKKVTGEDLNQLDTDIKALQERGRRLEPLIRTDVFTQSS